MNKSLKDWVDLLAEKEAEGRKEAILDEGTTLDLERMKYKQKEMLRKKQQINKQF